MSAGITWFKTAATWVGLFGYEQLAEDTGLQPAPPADLPAYRGITLAVNVPDESAVDRAFAHVTSIGARIVKPPMRADWGGYSGYFADPDGHLWEIAFAPGFAVDEHGRIEIS